MGTNRKPLKFVFKKENRFLGSKDMIKKQKKLGILGKSHFFDRKSLNWSNLVKTYRNSLLVEKYSKLNKEHEFDAKNIIKCSFRELLAFWSKQMTIFDLHMILGKYKKIFQ
jgi:hypothetical protein